MILKKINRTIESCWWCGSNNLTGEHKFKATDLIELFGKWHKTKKYNPILIKDKKALPLQSPKSNRLKFNRCICANCNGNKSSPFDESYQKFVAFILSNRKSIFQNGFISLEELYPEQLETNFLNLLRYFCKQLACQVSTGFFEVSPNIINFLNNDIDFLKDVKFFFELRTQNYLLEELLDGDDFRVLYLGEFKYKQSKHQLAELLVDSLTGWYTISLVSINYHYEKNCAIKSDIYNPILSKKIILNRTPDNAIESELGKENILEIIPILEKKGRTENTSIFFSFIQKIKNSR